MAADQVHDVVPGRPAPERAVGDHGATGPAAGDARTGVHRPLGTVVAVVAVCCALALAACSGDDDAAATATTTTLRPAPSTTTPTPPEPDPPTAEEEVEAAYLAIMERYYERLEAPNPDDPSIADGHVGESLEQVIARNRQRLLEGQRDVAGPRGRPRPEILSVSIDDEEATILNCLVEDVRVVDAESGQVVDDAVLSFEVRSVLRLSNEVWKLSEQVATGQWPDGRGCDR